jgi:hypothetical protein
VSSPGEPIGVKEIEREILLLQAAFATKTPRLTPSSCLGVFVTLWHNRKVPIAKEVL